MLIIVSKLCGGGVPSRLLIKEYTRVGYDESVISSWEILFDDFVFKAALLPAECNNCKATIR
jgi:hypothetical protein